MRKIGVFILRAINAFLNIFIVYFNDIEDLAKQQSGRKHLSFFLKRTMDLVFSFFGLIFFAPVILIAAFIIRSSSPGPLIYKQERVGKAGKIFAIYKIRTMIEDAEANTGPVWAKKKDSRIVRGGNFIREYHIDELPQLYNVLKGEMSLVGPRPERPKFVRQFYHLIPDYFQRLRVKPGITGYAQIRYKYDERVSDVAAKLRYERFYIQKLCFIVDISILWETLKKIVVKGGRYDKEKKLAHV